MTTLTPREQLEQAFFDAGLQPLRQKRAGTIEFWGLAGQKYGAGFFVSLHDMYRAGRGLRRPRGFEEKVVVKPAHIMRRRAGLTWYRPEKMPWGQAGLHYSGGKGLDDLVEKVHGWLTEMAERTSACQAVDRLIMSIRRDIRRAIRQGRAIPDPVALQDMAIAAVAIYPEVTLDNLKTKDSTAGYFLDKLLTLEKWTIKTVSIASETLCLPMSETLAMHKSIQEGSK